ncbi:hypothetical protein K435DRAFT_798832 [Dendrothele bispora CBS 962.96]|uniref:Uncharacterized protein n=1 Tax=Dendrothele bispora (strain CBS 962.96) TaxID=1314807 RepID=A0A4S8LXZ1_DENBC|nr:hypothetical protein K435DRAFT_798832 [Dendrothele bispora CBS 962.96]
MSAATDEVLQPPSLPAFGKTASVIQGHSQDKEPSAVPVQLPYEAYNHLDASIHRAGGYARQPPIPRLPKRTPLHEAAKFAVAEELFGDINPLDSSESNSQITTPSKHAKPTCVASPGTIKAARNRRNNPLERGKHVCSECGQDFTAKHNLESKLSYSNTD